MANDINSLFYAQVAQLIAERFGFCRENGLRLCLLKEERKSLFNGRDKINETG